jgi:hypothetical protein
MKKLIGFLAAFGMVCFLLSCESSRPAGAASAKQSSEPSQAGQKASPGKTITMRCRYQPGQSETVHYNNEHMYKSWIEDSKQPPSQTSQRVTRISQVLRREVESVEADGSAIMKITIQEAQIVLNVDTPRQKKQENYRSTSEGTNSTWEKPPVLAGVSYHIKIAPDTAVKEIPDLEQARKNLDITDSSPSPVAVLLSEEGIRKVHQRDFVMASPPEVQKGLSYDFLTPIPDRMIKAPAVKKTFHVEAIDSAQDIATVQVTGEAAVTAPKDFPPAPKPTDMPQVMIKNSSDMQELKITGQGQFDFKKERVVSEKGTVNCLLALFEESLMEKKKSEKKEGYGVMFTQISIEQSFEVKPY